MIKDQIYQSLNSYLNQQYNYVLPNCFVGYYEFDMLCINHKSGYFSEFEIKISKSDFKRDFKKGVSKLKAK